MESLHDWPERSNPEPDLTTLGAFLCVEEYSQVAREHILKYAADCGTLEGCDRLDPEDRAEADALLEASWPPVPSVSHAWDLDSWKGAPTRWWAVEPPEPDPGPFEPSEEDEAFYVAWSDSLQPVGVTLDVEPFHPGA